MKGYIAKHAFFVFFLWPLAILSQVNSENRGVIKVSKGTNERIYIKAVPCFNKFNTVKIKHLDIVVNKVPPAPVLTWFPDPFDYTFYLNSWFKTKDYDLKGKSADTVELDVLVLANGKVYLKDKSKTMRVVGTNIVAIYNPKESAYEINNLHMNCLDFMGRIKHWKPGYIVLPSSDLFGRRREKKLNVDVSGTITILFSTKPFEE